MSIFYFHGRHGQHLFVARAAGKREFNEIYLHLDPLVPQAEAAWATRHRIQSGLKAVISTEQEGSP